MSNKVFCLIKIIIGFKFLFWNVSECNEDWSTEIKLTALNPTIDRRHCNTCNVIRPHLWMYKRNTINVVSLEMSNMAHWQISVPGSFNRSRCQSIKSAIFNMANWQTSGPALLNRFRCPSTALYSIFQRLITILSKYSSINV